MEFETESGAVVTDEMLDKMAEEYENGTWSGHEDVAMGRPCSRIRAVEAVAKRRGMRKSDFFREAIDKALLASE